MTYKDWIREGQAELAATPPMPAREWAQLLGEMEAPDELPPDQADRRLWGMAARMHDALHGQRDGDA